MARYRVHVECSRTVRETNSVYSQCVAYEVGAATVGIARAKAVELAEREKPEYDGFRVYHVELLQSRRPLARRGDPAPSEREPFSEEGEANAKRK